MNYLIKKMPSNKCHHCLSNALMLVTIKGKEFPVNYLMNNQELIDKTVFTKIRCRHCGREYELDWSSQNGIPEPLIVSKLEEFDKKLWRS